MLGGVGFKFTSKISRDLEIKGGGLGGLWIDVVRRYFRSLPAEIARLGCFRHAFAGDILVYDAIEEYSKSTKERNRVFLRADWSELPRPFAETFGDGYVMVDGMKHAGMPAC